MHRPDSPAPDTLVLGGGGVLGEAWLSSVLAGIAAAGGFDARECGRFVGTSAGSIVAASLLAGMAPGDRLDLDSHARSEPLGGSAREEPAGPLDGVLAAALQVGGAAAAPLASLTLSSTAPGGALVRRAILARVPEGQRSHAPLMRLVERAGLGGFDGRLLISAVDVRSGRRVMFGAPGAPPSTIAQAVAASCAIPGVFEPVGIGGRGYVDGGAWSPTNMDAMPVRRGERVLCLNPTGSLRPSRRTLGGVFGPLSRTACAGEALALRHRGAEVTVVNPDAASAQAMGLRLMDPSRRGAVAATGHAQGMRLAEGAARAA